MSKIQTANQIMPRVNPYPSNTLSPVGACMSLALQANEKAPHGGYGPHFSEFNTVEYIQLPTSLHHFSSNFNTPL